MKPPVRHHSRTKANRLLEQLRGPADLAELEPGRGVPDVCIRCKQASDAWTYIGPDTVTGAGVYVCSGCYAELLHA